MTVGLAPRQADLMKGTASFVAGRVKKSSIFTVLHRECHVLFADELFADFIRGLSSHASEPVPGHPARVGASEGAPSTRLAVSG